MQMSETQTVDILIIGAGVIGVSTAYALAEAGYPSTVLDQADICAGSSHGNAGLIVPSHALPLARPGVIRQGMRWLLDSKSPFYIRPRLDRDLWRWLWHFYHAANSATERRVIPILHALNRISLEIYRELDHRLEHGFGFQPSGGLFLFRTEKGLEDGRAEARLLAEFGIASRRLDAAETISMAGQLPRPVAGSIYYADDAHLQPARFVHGLAAATKKKGVTFQKRTKVLDLMVESGCVTGVETNRGRFRSRKIVLAAGAWSPGLVRRLNLRLPIQPAKGYSITAPRPVSFPELHMHLTESKVAVTPLGDRLRFAGTLELAGLDLSISRRRLAAIAEAARGYLGIDPLEDAVEVWRGLRPLTPDTLPLVGPLPGLDNLIVAGGHGMLGMAMGPATGRLVSQLLLGEPTDIDLAPLRPARFS